MIQIYYNTINHTTLQYIIYAYIYNRERDTHMYVNIYIYIEI